jgi:hypothetical protein
MVSVNEGSAVATEPFSDRSAGGCVNSEVFSPTEIGAVRQARGALQEKCATQQSFSRNPKRQRMSEVVRRSRVGLRGLGVRQRSRPTRHGETATIASLTGTFVYLVWSAPFCCV